MLKYLVIFSLTLNLFISASAAEGVLLIDFLLNGSGVVEILGKYGIKGNDASLVQSYMASSLVALSSKKSLTKEELRLALSKLPVSGGDATVRKNLQILF